MNTKETIKSKLQQLLANIRNVEIIDDINNIVWNHIDDGQYETKYDIAHYISNQLNGIKCSIELMEQYEEEKNNEFADEHFDDAKWNIKCLIRYVEETL